MNLEGEKTSIQILKARLNGLKLKTLESKRVFASYYLDDLLDKDGVPLLTDAQAKKLGVEL